MEESKRCRIHRKIWGAFGWTCIVIALLCMVGLLVVLVMIGLGNERMLLLGSLCAGTAGGAALFGLAGLLSVRRNEMWYGRETDALERADGEDSFFIGEETLATFEKDALVIHGGKQKTAVPYEKIRLFSVCTRRRAREKGEWSVLIEVPASYVMKRAKKEEAPVLVQADGKERLYAVLRKRGLELLGELPGKDGAQEKKFHRLEKFDLPDPKKRKRSLLFMLLGGAAVCGSVGVAFLTVPVGAVIAVAGLYLLGRSAVNFLCAKQTLAVYGEGLYFKGNSLRESFFLKWEEIVSLKPAETEIAVIRAECLYGAYDIPRPVGAYEYLKEKFPEKCAE